MRKLRVGIIDLVHKGPTKALYARVMHANMASIMPQAVAVWCEQEGHDVTMSCYTGLEELSDLLPEQVDVVFIGAFTQSAQTAYALSNWYRHKGAVTVLGGPHARCYPQDAQKYFDYVCGFTDQQIIRDILEDASPHRPMGRYLTADRQPSELPGVQERWKYIDATLKKAPLIKIVPMIGSMGCPYTCSFCIDSVVPYQPLDFEVMKDDLRFLLTKFKKPMVGWHDPNFGVRFNDYMDAVEEAAPGGSFTFVAESSLSILTEEHLKRMQKNGFQGMLPGIESWYDMGNKSKSGQNKGQEKLQKVSAQVNEVLSYIPYVQANFVFGLDVDEGNEPFELTRKFVDMSPGAFPGYSLLSAFGQAAPLNLGYQREGRVLPFPFHFLNNNHAMNVKPLNYEWPEFYDHVIATTAHTFSNKNIYRRFMNNKHITAKWMNFVRAISSEGYGRLRFFAKIRKMLVEDRQFRAFFEGETTEVPQFYQDIIKKDLGSLYEWLPEGAMFHDHLAYMKADDAKKAAKVKVKTPDKV